MPMFRSGALHRCDFSRFIAGATAVTALSLPVIFVLAVAAIGYVQGCCSDDLILEVAICVVSLGVGLTATLTALAKGPDGVLNAERRAARDLLRTTQRRCLTTWTSGELLASAVRTVMVRLEDVLPVTSLPRLPDLNLTPRLLPIPVAR